MKENVKFESSGFKEAIDAMSKTQEAFKNLGKAIEQFNNAQPSKGVKLKRKLVGFLAGILNKEIFGGTILYWINILLVQWFFTRITRNEDWTKFGLLRPVLPLTGWWNNYIYIFPKQAKKSN